MATHPSNLAWKISQTVEPSRLQSMRLQSQTQLSTHTQEISFHKLSVAQIDRIWGTQMLYLLSNSSSFSFHQFQFATLVSLEVAYIFFGICVVIDIKFQYVDSNHQSVQFSHSVVFDSLQPYGLQHARLPVHHQHLELTQTHVHQVGDAIQPSHPRSSPSPPAFNLSQHQGLFKGVSSSHQVAKYWSFSFSISPSNE